MNNVLLINTNQEQVPYPVMPAGLCSIASYLKSEGFCVKILDLCFCNNAKERIREALRSFNADSICLSIRNIDNGEYLITKSYLRQIKTLVDCCREFSKSPIFIGGPAVNIMPETIKEYLGVDFAVAGYIDTTGKPFQWITIKNYLSRGGTVPIQTKRGCRFNCIYCSYRNIEGDYIRLREPEAVVDEIEEIMEGSKVRDFEFVDAVFNFPESHAKEICRKIIKRRLRANFGVACLNPVGCSEELFALFKEADFRWLIITPESGSDKMLGNLNKGFTMLEVLRVADLVKRFKIPTLWAFLVGGPGETIETVYETLDFIDKHIDKKDIAYITVGVRVYPNTFMAKVAMDEGIFQKVHQLIEPVFYLSKSINKIELKNILLDFSMTHPNFICSYEAHMPIFGLAARLFYYLNIPRPYWRYAPIFNRIRRII